MELKYCQCCGRLFARPAVASILEDEEGNLVMQRKPSDCAVCIVSPPEEDTTIMTRTYRVTGIKVRL